MRFYKFGVVLATRNGTNCYSTRSLERHAFEGNGNADVENMARRNGSGGR